MKAVIEKGIRDEVLRDPANPIHRIADQLRPYLEVIVEQFHPKAIYLFGSHAYGNPNRDSDVDLLIVKEIEESAIQDATRIRKAIRPLRHRGANLPLDIMVRAPDDWESRVAGGSMMHDAIARKGLRLF